MKKILILLLLAITILESNAQFGAFRVTNKYAVQIGYSNYRYLSFGNCTEDPTKGNWAIEDDGEGFNFWKPWPSYNSGNFKLYISQYDGVGISMKPYVGTRTTPKNHSIWTFKLQVNGRIAADGLWKWSDQNLKEDIHTLDSSLTTLLKLRPVSYKFKPNRVLGDQNLSANDSILNDSSKYFIQHPEIQDKHNDLDLQFGFLAQEVELIYPHLVADIGDKKAVNYDGLIPVLVKSIQEQQKQIQDLKTEVDYLRTNNVVLGTSKSKLYQNEPNPFKDITYIAYYIDEEVPFTTANILVRDLNGLLKTTIPLSDKSGIGKIEHNFGNLTNGYYVYSLLIDGVTVDTKLFLINND